MVDVEGTINEIIIKNFKSIHNIHLRLKKGVNVLIGANGSGKTNILEALYFLRKALVDEYDREPYLPHLEWWDPLNLLPERKENILQYIVKGKLYGFIDFEYKVSFALSPDRTTLIPVEHIIIFNNRSILKLRPGSIEIGLDKKLLDYLMSKINEIKEETYHTKKTGMPILMFSTRVLSSMYSIIKEMLSECIEDICFTSISFPWDKPFINVSDLLRIFRIPGRIVIDFDKNKDLYLVMIFSTIVIREKDEIGKTLKKIPLILFGPLTMSESRIVRRMYPETPWDAIKELIGRIVFIKHPDIGSIRKPKRIESYTRLDSRAENLVSVMYRLRRVNRGFMDRISEALSMFFPNIQIDFDMLPDGRLSLVMYEHGEAYPSPCIPDGMIKLLTILTALELKPSLLLIDEVENSMHARMLEYVFDELNNANFPVLIATHSPYFIDLTDLDRIFIVEKTLEEGTIVKTITDTVKLKKKLHELGISFSEYFLS